MTTELSDGKSGDTTHNSDRIPSDDKERSATGSSESKRTERIDMNSRLAHSSSGKKEETKSSRSDEDESKHSKDEHGKDGPNRSLIVIGGVIIVLAALIGFFVWQAHNTQDSNELQISGRIEATETHISAAMPGRVKAVAVKEGDAVHKGQLLIAIDSQDVHIKMQEAGEGINAAQEAKKQAALLVQSAQGDAGQVRSQAAEAQEQAMSQVQKANSDIEKAQAKSHGFLSHFVSKKQKQEKADQLRQEMMQAQMQAKAVESGVDEKAGKVSQEMTQAQLQMNQASSAVAKARAVKEEASSKLSYFNITSPVDGICAIRSIEPGELVAPGQILMTVIDPNSAFMKGFVPEGNIGSIKIGQAAQVFLDSNAKKPLQAKISSIDPVASFTPENVYFKQDRVKQVFGIKLTIDHPDGLAKPGMPADARIDLTGQRKPK